MTSGLSVAGPADLLQRIAAALAFAGSVLAGSLALSSTASQDAWAVTASEWGSALTADAEAPPTRASVERAVFELQRARRTLEALGNDRTDSTCMYVSALDNLLRPYEGAQHLVERQIQVFAGALEQAWSNLLRSAGPNSGAVSCAAIESHPSRPRLVDGDGLAAVLVRDMELVGLVYESLDRAQQVFGRDASFALEPFVDPESPSGTSRVFLVVRTTLDVEAAGRRMEALDEWWIGHLHRACGLLSIAIDYV